MTTYIALLRGINVSGKNIIKMADLKSQIEKMGFENVQTYIQSGNVIFDSEINDTTQIKAKIELMIECVYGFLVPVWVRTADAFYTAKTKNPFLEEDGVDETKLHVTFLSENPDASLILKINDFDFGQDAFKIVNDSIYLNCPNGYGKTKLTNNFFEHKLKVKATTRNWKTVCKLIELAN